MSSRSFGKSLLVAQLKRLNLDDVPLVGREEEITQLRAAIASSEYPLIALTGYSGVGKTTLVNRFADDIDEDEEWFLSGKFDQQASSMPFSAFALALTRLANRYTHEIQTLLKESPPSDEQLELIQGVIPSLSKVLPPISVDDPKSEHLTVEGTYRSERIRAALVLLFHTLATDRKVILFLDDLQWADEASLELVEFLATPRGKHSNLTTILAFRNNEISGAPGLGKTLETCNPLFIELGNLSIEDLRKLVGNVLKRRPEEEDILELAMALHRKTQGNAYFTLQLIVWLQRKMILHYSVETYRWEWDLNEINVESTLSDNVVNLVSDKLQDLSPTSRVVVMIGSCLGSRFDKGLVLKLIDAQVLPIAAVKEDLDFDTLVIEGVLSRRGDMFRFSHDRVQQAARLLFDDQNHRERTHFLIGKFLMDEKPSSDSSCFLLEDRNLYHLLATDQLNLGASSINDDAQKWELIMYNSQAAEIAIEKSAFVEAERFLRTAIQTLPASRLWSENQALAASMHNHWAETLLTLGEFDEVQRVTSKVLENATSPVDTCRAAYTRVDCLNSANMPLASIAFIIKHLRKLGMKLPSKPNKVHMILEFFKAKKNLKKTSVDVLCSRARCSAVHLGYQWLLSALADTLFTTNDPDASIFAYLRLLNLAFDQGPSKFTAIGIVYYGAILGAMGDFVGSHKVCKEANLLAQTFVSRNIYARMNTYLHVFLHHIRSPLHDSLEPFLQSFEMSMRSGSMMYACHACYCYSLCYFMCGFSLHPLTNDIKKYREIFLLRNNCDLLRCWLDVLGQAVENLIGDVDDIFVLHGETLEPALFIQKVTEEKNEVGLLTFWLFTLYTTYVLDPCSQHARAAFDELYFSKRVGTDTIEKTLLFTASSHTMLNTLAAISLERTTGLRKYTRKRKFLTKILNKYVTNGVPGNSHRTMLVEAEVLAMSRKASQDEVKKAYEKAISTASRTGFMPDCAMANERCGEYFLRKGDSDWASYFLKRASQLYSEWGANGKVKHLEQKYPSIYSNKDDANTRSSSGMRSRERYMSVVQRHDAPVSQLLFESSSNRMSLSFSSLFNNSTGCFVEEP